MPLNPLRRASVRSVKPISYHKGHGARRRFARFAAVFQGEVQKRVSRASRPPPTAQLRPCTRHTDTVLAHCGQTDKQPYRLFSVEGCSNGVCDLAQKRQRNRNNEER